MTYTQEDISSKAETPMFPSLTQLTLLLSLLLLISSGQSSATEWVAVLDEDNIDDYRLFVGERDPLSIEHFYGPGARRDVVEIVLLQQALHLGGYKGKLVLRAENSYRRVLRLVREGNAALPASQMWLRDLEPHADELFITKALVQEGEFFAGIYTHPANYRALAARKASDLGNLRAATNGHWLADIHALESLGITQYRYATYWEQIVRMVVAGRADITLAPFQSNPDMKVIFNDLELVPISGIKVRLPGSRHWAVSKAHPNGAEIFAALNRGITIMEKENRIRRAYEECGFFHPEVKNWQLLNPLPKQ